MVNKKYNKNKLKYLILWHNLKKLRNNKKLNDIQFCKFKNLKIYILNYFLTEL